MEIEVSTERFDPALKLRVLDWVLEEQLAGRAPTSADVSRHFDLTIDRAELLREELDRMGELSGGPPKRRWKPWDE